MSALSKVDEIKVKHSAYTSTRAKKVREQLNQISNEDLVLWHDSLFHSSFETPKEHIEKCAKEYEADVIPF